MPIENFCPFAKKMKDIAENHLGVIIKILDYTIKREKNIDFFGKCCCKAQWLVL